LESESGSSTCAPRNGFTVNWLLLWLILSNPFASLATALMGAGSDWKPHSKAQNAEPP
jgi:hypothetical protein